MPTPLSAPETPRFPRVKRQTGWRSYFSPERTWVEAKRLAKADRDKADALDSWGMKMGPVVVGASVWCAALFTYLSSPESALDLVLSAGVVAVATWAFHPYLEFLRKLHYWHETVAVAFATAGIAAFAFAGSAAGAATVAFAFAGATSGAAAFAVAAAGTVAVAGAFALAVAFAGAFALAAAVTVAIAVAIAGAAAIAFAGAAAGAAAVAVATAGAVPAAFAVPIISMFVLKRAEAAYFRAKRYVKPSLSTHSAPQPERDEHRSTCLSRCERLLGAGPRHVTLGLAGQRGLGKTNMLRLLLKQPKTPKKSAIENKQDLRSAENVKHNRIRELTLFVHTPADFAEMNFLAALLEQLALSINAALAAVLPDVKPYRAERALRHKRKVLLPLHLLYFTLIGLVIGFAVYGYWSALPVETTQLASTVQVPSELYQAASDSLYERFEPRLNAYTDSLGLVAQLLNRTTRRNADPIPLSIAWDSLKQVWPSPALLDTLILEGLASTAYLDSVAARERDYVALQDTLLWLHASLRTASPWDDLDFYFLIAGIVFFPSLLLWRWSRTREGRSAFSSRAYDAVRNEIALYERTEVLLDRLRYQMSFGQSDSLSAKAGPFKSVGFSFRRSRQTTRAHRPFTVLSLVSAYRQYVQDALAYLNEALASDQEDDADPPPPVRLLIAIDELDKVLDAQRLHEMLKSIKAIFEIDHVYYFLSISEDVLETYRLRHLETKNEIDSAFSHVFHVPPMGASASLRFYAEGKTKPQWSPDLLGAAIALGGGVPRDMKRLAELFTLRSALTEPTPWDTKATCLQALYREDQEASTALVAQNTDLSDTWKHSSIASINQAWLAFPVDVEAELKEIAAWSFDTFLAENPCSGDAAKRTFHTLQSLRRSLVIKSHLYAYLNALDTPTVLNKWPASPKDILTNAHVERWLANVESVRAAIFTLSNNPLGTWDTFRAQHKA